MSERPPELSPQQLRSLLGTMYRIRAFEEKVDELFMRGEIHGTTHLSIGEEATPTGALMALQPDDYITSTHRGHGHCISKGADINLMMAELLGKETGYCRGRGGSMHIADVKAGNLGANGVVGGGIPIATGVGLSIQLQGNGRVCLCFFGDGASNEGTFHEAVNMAATWDLPVIFLCENNQYGMSMSTKRSMRNETIAQRATAYGIPGERVDGNDVFAVYEAVYKAAQRARAGQGPSLIEAYTYRYKGHSKSDQNRYRTRDEIREWQGRDPIKRLSEYLIAHNVMSQEEIKQEEAAAYQVIEDGYQFALSSPEPDPETLLEGVYA
ncbi:thiamine pyrophosphate-dependent dehydrogenase E1 component subunit alpha [Ktedonosporobacter rubrisoli]|uniref:Thiamine pyrophosphate-dependent dehydrogenase E1 component subunit alpha n=1 Tax=Ktedonosporobacter rubrisoli TaxID=2509675 RepID=A0A4P6JTB4_KTERU|nr:thiamine pyrophosphate-dependent dehydrogenase E1 component subunit alpha [Ktedonosporobacter rubrisoli]QBD78530.1 thiamine pyrophosphate-dependent dehydrogenase E1 component subunit alpha [Ktedonosporobacter rubrisoli]